jgi:hypothetical protein
MSTIIKYITGTGIDLIVKAKCRPSRMPALFWWVEFGGVEKYIPSNLVHDTFQDAKDKVLNGLLIGTLKDPEKYMPELARAEAIQEKEVQEV